MSSTKIAAAELRQILTDYCRSSYGAKCPDIDELRSFLSGVSENERFGLFSSIGDSNNLTVLTKAAVRGHTELCATLLSSLPPADRLKLILVNKLTALHSAACRGYTETVLGILNCLTAEQQLQLLFKQGSSSGKTALHYVAQEGNAETVKTLLDNLTFEQQLKLLTIQDNKRKTASQSAVNTETIETLEEYRCQAEYRLNYRELHLCSNPT